MDDVLAQVRIHSGDAARDVEVVVNNRKVEDAFQYRIEQSAYDGTFATVTLHLHPRNASLFEAKKARLKIESACVHCGFTHRQALLPLNKSDATRLEEVLQALQNPITGDLLSTSEYIESLLRDVRTSLDAFDPTSDTAIAKYGESNIRSLAFEDEERQGSPSAYPATGSSGVDFARAALEGKRQRAGEEGTSESADQADDSGGRPVGGGDREGQDGDSEVGHWPTRDAIGEGEDPED